MYPYFILKPILRTLFPLSLQLINDMKTPGSIDFRFNSIVQFNKVCVNDTPVVAQKLKVRAGVLTKAILTDNKLGGGGKHESLAISQ
jgi:hypothetical protein